MPVTRLYNFKPGTVIKSLEANAEFNNLVTFSNNLEKTVGTNKTSAETALNNHKTAATLDHPDGSVTAAKIAANAVTTTKIADGAVTTQKIANSAITTALLFDGAVTSNKIPANAISATHLQTGSVTNAKLGASSVSADKLANGAVSTVKIVDGAVTSTKIADSAVVTTKIANAAVIADKIADDAVTTGKIINTAVTEAKIAEAAVTTSRIAPGAVVASKIENGSISEGKLSDNAVSTAKISDNAVTERKIANSAVGTSKIADSAVTRNKIANGAVNTDKLDPELSGIIGGFVKIADLSNLQRVTHISNIPQNYSHLRIIATTRSNGPASYIWLRINDISTNDYWLVSSTTPLNAVQLGSIPASDADPGFFGTTDVILGDYTNKNTAKIVQGMHSSKATKAEAGKVAWIAYLLDKRTEVTSLTFIIGQADYTPDPDSRIVVYGMK